MYVDSLLCHSRRTAGKHYRLTQRKKNAIRGTKVLEEVFSRKIKVEWDKKKTDELETIFKQNLESQKVSIEDVRSQSFQFKEIKGLQEKQIIDKIRSYWRNSGNIFLLRVPSWHSDIKSEHFLKLKLIWLKRNHKMGVCWLSGSWVFIWVLTK